MSASGPSGPLVCILYDHAKSKVYYLYRRSYMSADALLELLNKWRNSNKMRGFYNKVYLVI